MNNIDLKKIFGVIFLILGSVILVFASFALMREEGSNLFGTVVRGYRTIVPVVLGLIFFFTGIKFIK
jgi:hypothetical protein